MLLIQTLPRTLLGVPISLAAAATPNVIFAMADDLGWGDIQYNNGNARTPNLDEMAQSPNTILLQRYYSGGPVCSPTRGTLLTGRNHDRYCVWTANAGGYSPDFAKPETMPLPLSEITVAEVMRGLKLVRGPNLVAKIGPARLVRCRISIEFIASYQVLHASGVRPCTL